MICFAIKHGVPFDVAHAMEDWQLLAYVITFAQYENGNQAWDWDRMTFIERK
jgi:hypothetical protein